MAWLAFVGRQVSAALEPGYNRVGAVHIVLVALPAVGAASCGFDTDLGAVSVDILHAVVGRQGRHKGRAVAEIVAAFEAAAAAGIDEAALAAQF